MLTIPVFLAVTAAYMVKGMCLPHIFYLADKEKEVYRCQYCDEKHS